MSVSGITAQLTNVAPDGSLVGIVVRPNKGIDEGREVVQPKPGDETDGRSIARFPMPRSRQKESDQANEAPERIVRMAHVELNSGEKKVKSQERATSNTCIGVATLLLLSCMSWVTPQLDDATGTKEWNTHTVCEQRRGHATRILHNTMQVVCDPRNKQAALVRADPLLH